MKIALAQMDVHLADLAANQAALHKMAVQAAAQDCDLLLAPELWSTGYACAARASLASPLDAGSFAWLAGLAAEFHIAVGGSMLEQRGTDFYNTFALYDSAGARAGLYRKVHLFRPMGEHTWLQPGGELSLAQPAWGSTGLAVCYDLRFPEMFRRYALQGARLILLPAQWPAARAEHWRVLLRARAIDNQVFIAGVNRVGASAGETFGGASAVIDPTGAVLVEGGDSPGLLTAEVDLSACEQARAQIPILSDRRPELY